MKLSGGSVIAGVLATVAAAYALLQIVPLGSTLGTVIVVAASALFVIGAGFVWAIARRLRRDRSPGPGNR